jgi:uncharacterized protein (DUF362 family)/NAD-dependent dihydropyrimidine dehydrogenase PreA subunit
MPDTPAKSHPATTPPTLAAGSASGRSRVAVAACASYEPAAVAAALAEVLAAMGGIAASVKPGQTVLLKPNLLSPRAPELAVTTHPELVRQMILQCARAGAARIWVGDSPAGEHAEANLWARTGMTGAVEGTPAVLKSWQTRKTAVVCGDDALAVPEWYSEVDVVISLAKLKTHSLTTLTCGLKNVFGIVGGQAKSNYHAKYPSPLAMSEFLVRVFAVLKPHLTIVDAVLAMEGNGPASGHPLPVGVLLAGRDAVALDAVACAALRIPPSAVPMIRLAAAANLGRMDEAAIECVGSGVTPLRAARLRPSCSRFLRYIPESLFGLATRVLRLRPRIQDRQCVKCGICAGVCPRQAIETQTRSGYPFIRPADCIVCFCCMESCPRGAIAVQLYVGTLFRLAQRMRKTVPPP